MEGTEVRRYRPFDDAPVEGKFDWKGFTRNLVYGVLTAAALIAASIFTGGLAAAAFLGVGIAAGVTTAVISVTDYSTGNVRSYEEAKHAIDTAAVLGAVTGAVSCLLAGVEIFANPIADMVIKEVIEGYAETKAGIVLRSLESIGMPPEERLAYIYDWKTILLDFGVGTLIGIGVGSAGIAFKSAAGELAEQAAKEATEEVLEGAAERTAKEAAEEAAERAAKEAAEEAAERAAKEATEEVAERAAKEAAEETAERATKETYKVFFDDFMSPEDARRYRQFYKNGSTAGLRPEELLGIQKVDDYLALSRVDYDEVLRLRNSATGGGLDVIEIGRIDLDALRSKLGVLETDTIAVGKTNVKGLKDIVFEGQSPKVRIEAGLPDLDEIWAARNIKAPGNNPLFTRHAEEVLANDFDRAVIEAGINPQDVSGVLKIHQSNPTGVCTKCIQGLANDNVKPGVLKQLSLKYPNLRIEVSSEILPDVKVTGKSNFVIQNGKYVE